MAAQATLRLVREDDADQIAAIYEPYARDTAITFVYAAPTGTDFRDRIQRSIDRLPWFVCERDGLVTGYAYAGPHRVSPPTAGLSRPPSISTRSTTARASTQRCTSLSWERSACSDTTAPTPESRSRTLQASDYTRPWASSRPARFTRSATSTERGETSYGWSTCWETPTSLLRSRWASLSCSERRNGKPQSQPDRRSCANARRRLHALRTRA